MLQKLCRVAFIRVGHGEMVKCHVSFKEIEGTWCRMSLRWPLQVFTAVLHSCLDTVP